VVSETADVPVEHQVKSALHWLKRHSSKRALEGMARYAIPSNKAMGVPVSDIKRLGTLLGRNQELALALWKTGIYEARMLTQFVGDPARLTPAQMDRWCREFDNWAICDALCFNLFDRTPHAWKKVEQWSRSRGEFSRRAAFALLWSLSLHDKKAGDASFLRGLELIEEGAQDERNFVSKAVNMALRSIARRNATLHAGAQQVARRLADAPNAGPRWVGKHALRELTSRGVPRST
jgi:3-methyladenine DNA glycosylase AlkD